MALGSVLVAAADPGRDLDRDVAMAAGAHQRLLAVLDELVAADAFDVAAPSRLPGWTKGHVLTHVARGGDGHARILVGAAEGQVVTQYEGGPEGRAAEIESGASRPARQQLDDLRRSIWRLESLWATTTWEGRGIAPSGAEIPLRELPFLRTREVAIHHVDLDVGDEFEDLPSEYVRLELRRMEMLWRASRPMGLTPLPAAALTLPPPARLAWLTGRRSVEGLDPAGIF